LAPQPTTTPKAAPRAAVFATTATSRRPPYIPAAAALVVIIAIVGVVAGIVPPRQQEVAAITDAPTGPNGEPTGFVVAPVESDDPTTGPTATDAVVTPGETPTDRPGVDDPNPTPKPPPPDPDRTPKPPKPTPTPDTSTPTPAPTPTPPPPTPTPEPECVVPNFVNTLPSKADQKWANSGFTGSVIFDGSFPAGSKIEWQSVPAGTSLPCSSDITVSDIVPPAPAR
jgi:hypothetical protein